MIRAALCINKMWCYPSKMGLNLNKMIMFLVLRKTVEYKGNWILLFVIYLKVNISEFRLTSQIINYYCKFDLKAFVICLFAVSSVCILALFLTLFTNHSVYRKKYIQIQWKKSSIYIWVSSWISLWLPIRMLNITSCNLWVCKWISSVCERQIYAKYLPI